MKLFTSVPKSWLEAVFSYQIWALFFNIWVQYPQHLIPWHFVSEAVRMVSEAVRMVRISKDLEILVLIVNKYMVQLVC